MGIRLDVRSEDDQGLPVVGWEEDRNVFAPEGPGPDRVACFIRPDSDGVLQFVSVGAVRHGDVVEARPWEKLVSFEISRADQQYYSAGHKALLDVVASKSKSGIGRLLVTDGAVVILANFADARRGEPMHLNCADCTPVEAVRLHDRLRLEFLDRRLDLVAEQCNGRFVWPRDVPFTVHKPPEAVTLSWWTLRLVDLTVLGILGLLGWGFYLLVR